MMSSTTPNNYHQHDTGTKKTPFTGKTEIFHRIGLLPKIFTYLKLVGVDGDDAVGHVENCLKCCQ